MDEKFIALLYHLKEEYGANIFANTQKVKALLMDLAPEMKKEFYLFTNLLNSNAYRELIGADYSAFYRVLHSMENIYSIKKASAVWIINAFCSVMNGHVFIAEDEHSPEESSQTHIAATVTFSSPEELDPGLDIAAIGGQHTVAIGRNDELLAIGSNDYGQINVQEFENIVSVKAGENNTLALASDGRVFSCGDNEYGQCNVENWEDVKSIAVVKNRTVGLLKNGELVFAGKDADAMRESDKWTDITYIAASDEIVAGIKKTGKVVISDNNINVSHWRDIVSIAASNSHIVGLTSNGYVLAAGRNNFNQCEVERWRGITQIAVGETGYILIGSAQESTFAILKEIERIFANDGQVKRQVHRIIVMQDKIVRDYESLSNASDFTLKALNDEFLRLLTLLNIRDLSTASRFKEAYESFMLFAQNPEKYEFVSGCHTVGLKNDGTVLATGWNDYGQCDVLGFFNVKKLVVGGFHTIGIRYDKTIHFAGSNSYNQNHTESWQNVNEIYISKKGDSIIGVADGKLLNAGNNDFGQCDVDYWEIRSRYK